MRMIVCGANLSTGGGATKPSGTKDDGRGLSEMEQGNLFECFGGAGAGLGLFLVRQIVASWGGAITVRSAPGAGTKTSEHRRPSRVVAGAVLDE